MSRRVRSLSFAFACTTLIACATDDGVEPATLDEAAQASTSVEATTEATYATSLIAVDASAYASARVADAPAALIAAVEERLADGLTAPACATIATDQRTYVEVTFTSCVGPRGLRGLSGALRAEITVEPTPCGPFECVGAITYQVSTSGLTLNGTTFAGTWSWRDPVAAEQPSTWSGDLTISGPRRTLQSTSSATVAIADGCATYDLTAEVTTGARTLTVTATDVQRCLDACPTAGTVELVGARGALSWSYGGDGTAEVTTAGGTTFDVTLACAE